MIRRTVGLVCWLYQFFFCGGGGGGSGGGGCGVLMCLVYPTPSVVCLPYYLIFLCFLYFWEAGLCMRWSDLIWMIMCFLCIGRVLRRFLVLCGLYHFIPLLGFILVLWGLVIGQWAFSILIGWSVLVVRVYNEFFFILVGSTNDSSIIVRGCFYDFLLCRLLYIVITYNYYYKTIILSVVLYVSEAWFVALEVEQNLQVYVCEKRLLKV